MELDGDLKEDGTFDFSQVPAGKYDLELQSNEYKQVVAKMSVEVKNSNVTGLVFQVPNTFELKGNVHRPNTSHSESVQLQVFAADSASPLMSHPYWTDVASDGSFKIENVWPGRYVLSVGGGAPGDYVQSIQHAGREVLGVPVELAGSAASFEITLGGGAGRIDGSLQPTDASASLGGLQVVVVADEQHADLDGVLLVKTDQRGQFSFDNVAPGKYHAFAVADVEWGLLRNRGFANQFRATAIEVEVPENGNLQIRVPIVAAEEVRRALVILGL